MLEANEFHKKLLRYENGGMTPEEKQLFELELQQWESTPENDARIPLQNLLQQRKRSSPPPALLQQYHQDLQTRFAPRVDKTPWLNKLSEIFDVLIGNQAPWLRYAEIALLLVIGIFVGRAIFFTPSAPEKPLSRLSGMQYRNAPEFYLSGLTDADQIKMKAFFVESEMFLLQFINTDETEALVAGELDDSRETAQELLRSSLMIKEKAVHLNDLQTLHFVSRMEILLYEVANLNVEELSNSVAFLKETIDGTGLLKEVHFLNELFDAVKTKPVIL